MEHVATEGKTDKLMLDRVDLWSCLTDASMMIVKWEQMVNVFPYLCLQLDCSVQVLQSCFQLTHGCKALSSGKKVGSDLRL